MTNAPLQKYFQAIEKLLKAGKATEHSYRPALKDLLEELITGIKNLLPNSFRHL
jgi:hypothetical protein